MSTNNIRTFTKTGTSNIPRGRLVIWDATADWSVQLPGGTATDYLSPGVAQFGELANGQVDIYLAGSVATVEAGGTIAAGALIAGGNDGKAIARTTETHIVGVALTAAAGAGSYFEMLVMPYVTA